MRVVLPESPRLVVTKLKGAGNAEGKVASGMEVVYTVTFLPDEDCRHEYKDHILVCTERETFAVPVLAVGVLLCPTPFPHAQTIYRVPTRPHHFPSAPLIFPRDCTSPFPRVSTSCFFTRLHLLNLHAPLAS